MARIPSPPNLGQNQSLFAWLLESAVRLIVGFWLMFQVIGFAFWSIWHLSGHGFREFMFRGFIDLWQNHSWRLPEWVGYIPTWQTPWVWVLVALVALWWFWPRIKNRSRSEHDFSDAQASNGSAHDRSDPREDLHDDNGFGFNPWKWGKKRGEAITDPTHLIEEFKPRDNVEKAARAKANDPATGEAERQNIYKIIEKRRAKK